MTDSNHRTIDDVIALARRTESEPELNRHGEQFWASRILPILEEIRDGRRSSIPSDLSRSLADSADWKHPLFAAIGMLSQELRRKRRGFEVRPTPYAAAQVKRKLPKLHLVSSATGRLGPLELYYDPETVTYWEKSMTQKHYRLLEITRSEEWKPELSPASPVSRGERSVPGERA